MALWLGLPAIVFGLFFVGGSRADRQTLRRATRLTALMLLALCALLLLQACGGGGGGSSSQPGTPQPGTPSGTYTITVSAQSGTVQHTTTVTLVVQ